MGIGMEAETSQTANIIAVISAVAAVASAIISVIALAIAKRSADLSDRSAAASERSAGAAEKSLTTSISIFKRQGIIDLHMAWQGVNAIDPENPIGPDVRKLGEALVHIFEIQKQIYRDRPNLMPAFLKQPGSRPKSVSKKRLKRAGVGVGTRGQASKERFAEITSGRSL